MRAGAAHGRTHAAHGCTHADEQRRTMGAVRLLERALPPPWPPSWLPRISSPRSKSDASMLASAESAPKLSREKLASASEPSAASEVSSGAGMVAAAPCAAALPGESAGASKGLASMATSGRVGGGSQSMREGLHIAWCLF